MRVHSSGADNAYAIGVGSAAGVWWHIDVGCMGIMCLGTMPDIMRWIDAACQPVIAMGHQMLRWSCTPVPCCCFTEVAVAVGQGRVEHNASHSLRMLACLMPDVTDGNHGNNDQSICGEPAILSCLVVTTPGCRMADSLQYMYPPELP